MSISEIGFVREVPTHTTEKRGSTQQPHSTTDSKVGKISGSRFFMTGTPSQLRKRRDSGGNG